MRDRRVLTVLAALAAVVASFALATPARALRNGLTRTPPMGFNDWNAFGCDVDAKLIRATADVMARQGFRSAGYRYVNIDDCWLKKSRDRAGRLVPDPKKFPGGIRAVARYVHARGFRLGIYEDAGGATCAGYPGSYGHERTDAASFAAWGVDYLKFDWCNTADDANPRTLYARMRDALRATGRPIAYSLSVWGVRRPWLWGPRVANLWRTTGDIKDSWQSVVRIADLNARLWRHAGPGGWNDPDMLEIGNGGLTATESRAHFSLWAEMAAPLLMGTDVRKLSPAMRRILLNREVIAVDQDRRGVQGHVVDRQGAMSVWTKPLRGGSVAVLLFNRGDTPASMSVRLGPRLGLRRAPRYRVRDLWAHRTAVSAGTLSAGVDRHGVAMFRISPGSREGATAVSAVSGSTTATSPYVASDRTSVLTTTVRNDGPRTARDVLVHSGLPASWRVAGGSSDPAALGSLAPGESRTVTWAVRPPAATKPGWRTLRGSVRWGGGASAWEATVDVPPVPPSGTADVASARHWAYGSMTPTGDLSSRPHVDESASGTRLKVGGRRYARGIGVNAWSDVRYYLGGRCARFTTDVGIDDSVPPPSGGTIRGAVRVRVVVDGRTRFQRLMDWSMPAAHVDVPVTGATELRLVADATRDWIWDDVLDWTAPRLTCAA